MKTLTRVATAAALMVAAAGASAATTNWGVHDALENKLVFTSGAINDLFTFSLGSTFTVNSIADANVSGGYALFSAGLDGLAGTADDGSALLTGSFNNTLNSVVLGAGSYFYAAYGYGTGAYNLSSSLAAAPVPEPETYAMMLAGVGAIGFMARRRRSS